MPAPNPCVLQNQNQNPYPHLNQISNDTQMSSSRSFSRYANRSSTQSDPSSSTDLKNPDASYAIARSKSTKNDQNLTAMVKKFMEKKPKARDFVVAADVTTLIADDFRKKTSIRGGTTGFGGLHKKLFGSRESDRKKKALTDVKPNARTLAMVLRSERELLGQNKERETEITELKLMLEEKNREVDKLKDLCLKQREEIKALKNAILFPEKQEVDSQIVLKQANQIIPTLQRQVTSLTGQLHCLAQDLAEVKADKYSVMGCYVSSPRTPTNEQDEATNSLEFSSGDQTTPGSPDDMFLNDLNPCLTPYANSKSKSNSKEFENHSSLSYNNNTRCHGIGFGRKLSKSSGDKKYVNSAKNFGRRSDENNKYTYGGW
ncbi:hypothetical protein L1987_06637 [Smallanthus sonchifolius]|uniref:Uncharacterized protein n=1 Tax=Smallanthus sonchifolius TaxID=185202 RepID=A0ACB9JYW1_9ASTR|nr:hypothetical protein L1987_06637 [Smallanthus sonchifolius]